MGFRVAEINQYAVAHVPRDEAIEPDDDFGDGAVIGGDNLAEILGIETRRERRRADQVAEHHCQLPAFGVGLSCMAECCCHRGGRHRGTERSNRGEQFSAVADRGYADADQIFGCQLGQDLGVDIVVAERLLVLFEPQAVQPGCDVHPCLSDRSLSQLD